MPCVVAQASRLCARVHSSHRFEIANLRAQVFARRDQVRVVSQDNVAVKRKPGIPLQKVPRILNNVNRFSASEDRSQPTMGRQPQTITC